MILISKAEAEVIREEFPEAHVRRTCKQRSQRHNYWMTEEENAVAKISSMRGVPVKKLVHE